ncbi:MAG TPA: helix-turn-helix domain-containing protein [Candidatus Limnocylindria bacterium]|nr:helix-turn-helix domain-containing protein [Candidatus Limnocylindria bacterium]
MKDWVTIDEAVRRSGMSRATLYRLIAAGRVTRAKRAGDARAYVKLSDLERARALRPTPARPRRRDT